MKFTKIKVTILYFIIEKGYEAVFIQININI